MKKILNGVGRAIDLLAGAAGGLIFSILACMAMSTTLHIADVHARGLWVIYLGLVFVGPIIGLRRHDYFAQFLGPLFNAAAGHDGEGPFGPDNVSSIRDWFMQMLYGIAILFLIIAKVFTALTPLIISIMSLIAYSIYAKRSAQPAPTEGG
jgi:hypothetical protein